MDGVTFCEFTTSDGVTYPMPTASIGTLPPRVLASSEGRFEQHGIFDRAGVAMLGATHNYLSSTDGVMRAVHCGGG